MIIKKILFVFSLVLTILTLNLHASASITREFKPLYIVQNSSYDFYKEGYELLSPIPVLTECGNYKISYQELNSNIIYEQEIHIISKDYLIYEELVVPKVTELEQTRTDYIDKVKYEDGEIYLEKKDTFNFYLVKTTNNKITYSSKIFDETPCNFINIYYNEINDEVYVIGHGYYYGSGIDIVIICFDSNLEKKYVKQYKGYGIDYVFYSMYQNDNIYLLGTTTSSTNFYEHEKKGTDAFLITFDVFTRSSDYLDLSTLEIDNVTYLGYDKENLIIGLNNEVLVIDKVLNISKYKLPYLDNLYLKSIFFVDETINICGYHKDDLYESFIIRYDNNLDYEIVYSYFDEEFYLQVAYFNNEYDLFLTNQNKELAYIIIKDNPSPLNIIDKNYKIDRIKYSNGIKLDIDKKSCTLELHTIELKSNDYVYYNKNKLEPLVYDKTEENLGNYYISYYLETPYFYFVYNLINEVELKTNIQESNKYASGLKLLFNSSDAFLDGIKISSGCIVESEGIHHLTLLGKNIDPIEVDFQIVNLEYEDIKFEDYDIDASVKTDVNYQDFTLIKEKNLLENNINKNNQANLWYLIIPFFSSVSVIFFFNIFGKKL